MKRLIAAAFSFVLLSPATAEEPPKPTFAVKSALQFQLIEEPGDTVKDLSEVPEMIFNNNGDLVLRLTRKLGDAGSTSEEMEALVSYQQIPRETATPPSLTGRKIGNMLCYTAYLPNPSKMGEKQISCTTAGKPSRKLGIQEVTKELYCAQDSRNNLAILINTNTLPMVGPVIMTVQTVKGGKCKAGAK